MIRLEQEIESEGVSHMEPQNLPFRLVGAELYIDDKGRLFEKTAGTFNRCTSKEIEAEDRYVQRQLKKEGFTHE